MRRFALAAAFAVLPLVAHAAPGETFHAIDGGAEGCPSPDAMVAFDLGRITYALNGKLLGGAMGAMAAQCLPTSPDVQWRLVRMDGKYAVMRLDDAGKPLTLYFEPASMVDGSGHHPD